MFWQPIIKRFLNTRVMKLLISFFFFSFSPFSPLFSFSPSGGRLVLWKESSPPCNRRISVFPFSRHLLWGEGTGVTKLASRIRFLVRLRGSVVPLRWGWFLLPEVLVSWRLGFLRWCFSSMGLMMFSLLPGDLLRLLETSSRFVSFFFLSLCRGESWVLLIGACSEMSITLLKLELFLTS